MKRIVTVEIKDNEGVILNHTSFEAGGRFSYLSYGKKLSELLVPFLEDGPIVELTAMISENGDNKYFHQLETFKSKNGYVVRDCQPLDLFDGPFSLTAKVPYVWLDYINAEWNNNKFYSLSDVPGDPTQCAARYGRIGDIQGTTMFSNHAQKPFLYPIYMYYLKLNEKIQKGYEDHTKDRCSSKNSSSKVVVMNPLDSISDADVARLVKVLTDYANQTIEDNYSISVSNVTKTAIRKARKIIKELSGIKKDVDAFNKKMVELMHIIPRKVSMVSSCLAHDTSIFDSIVNDESDLLDILENQLKFQNKKETDEDESRNNILNIFGLEIYQATPEQSGKVKDHLSDELQKKLKNVYRVINKKTQKRFNAYLKEHNRPSVKQFWHGSRNANWWNIICQGLVLNSDAPQTGKMFGYGLYFAPSPTKSWGYTSSRGSYWAHGTSNVAYMGLYATAYGDPYEVLSWENGLGSYDKESFESKHPGKNCLHAKKDDGMLRNDEIIFYREEQVTINYICEFEA